MASATLTINETPRNIGGWMKVFYEINFVQKSKMPD